MMKNAAIITNMKKDKDLCVTKVLVDELKKYGWNVSFAEDLISATGEGSVIS